MWPITKEMYRATGQQVYTFLLSILSYFEFQDNNRIFCLHDSLLSTTSRYTNILYISSLFVSLITLQKQVNTHNHRNSISSSRVQSIERFILFPPRSKNPAFLSLNYSSFRPSLITPNPERPRRERQHT